jgi:hypothetical protein
VSDEKGRIVHGSGSDKVTEIDSVLRHVYEAIRVGIAELHRDRKLAQRLNAETKLRLVTMTDGELLLLAKMLAPPLGKSIEAYYKELSQVAEEHRRTAGDWIPELGISPVAGEEEQDGR